MTNAFVRFWLRGCAGNQPRITGTGIIGPSLGGVYYFDVVANSSGVISGTLYSNRDNAGTGNGEIECGGSYTATWYGMQTFVNGKGGPEVPIYAKNGATFDISNVTPITTTPVVVAPTGDSTYARIDGGNTPFTGPVTFTAKTAFGASSTFAGPVPYFDVTASAFGAIGDGTTDNTAAINAALSSCNNTVSAGNGLGVVFFPQSANPYNFSGPITMKNFCILAGPTNTVPGGGNPTPWLRCTATGSGRCIDARSTSHAGLSNIYLQYNSGSFTGTVVDAGTTGANTFSFYLINSQITGSSGVRTATCLLSLNHAQQAIVYNTAFHNAVNGICGATANTDFSNDNTVQDSIFSSSSGNDITGAHILNSGVIWHIVGNSFEMGSTSSVTPYVIDNRTGPTSSGDFLGNNILDNNFNDNRDLLSLAAGTGWDIAGNGLNGGGNASTCVRLSTGASGIHIHGNIVGQCAVLNVSGTVTNVEACDNQVGSGFLDISGTLGKGSRNCFANGNQTFYAGAGSFVNPTDGALTFSLGAGTTTDQNIFLPFLNHSGVAQYQFEQTSAGLFQLNDVNSILDLTANPAGPTALNAPAGQTVNAAVTTGAGLKFGGTLQSVGVAFGSLPAATAGWQIFCSNCVATTPASCSTATPASCVCTSGTGSMWARAENFQNNGLNWYCH